MTTTANCATVVFACAVDEARWQARHELGKFTYAGPRDCLGALDALDERVDMGSACRGSDVAPLLTAYLVVARKLVALPGIEDPAEVLRVLLDDAVQDTLEALELCHLAAFDPVGTLAAKLGFMGSVFVDAYSGQPLYAGA
jgi:hypothetical protein